MPRMRASRSVSAGTSARPEQESPFEHPSFELLYMQVLDHVADRRLDERQRKAAARAVGFLLREQVVNEAVTTDVLTAIHASLDLAAVVRTLLLGLVGVSAPEKITEWTRAVADRALREGKLPSFVAAMRILVELRDYDGEVPTLWRLSILRAVEVPELAPRVLLVVKTYAHRFPEQSWPWVRQARTRSMVAVLRRRVTVAEMREAREP